VSSSDPLVNDEPVKTSMHCHQCSKGFIAEIDYRIEGDHVVECPHCGHPHCRTIKGGKVTQARWDSPSHPANVEKRRTWKHDVLQMKTSSASDFIRDRWLETLT
jgi:DNA-directed RNA polymerase subunit RPC12/RpoP